MFKLNSKVQQFCKMKFASLPLKMSLFHKKYDASNWFSFNIKFSTCFEEQYQDVEWLLINLHEFCMELRNSKNFKNNLNIQRILITIPNHYCHPKQLPTNPNHYQASPRRTNLPKAFPSMNNLLQENIPKNSCKFINCHSKSWYCSSKHVMSLMLHENKLLTSYFLWNTLILRGKDANFILQNCCTFEHQGSIFGNCTLYFHKAWMKIK